MSLSRVTVYRRVVLRTPFLDETRVATDDAAALGRGVHTASAGHMAQGVAFVVEQRDISCSVIVPNNAPQTKLAAVSRRGGTGIKVS